MKYILALFVSVAQADELPKQFEYQYTESVKIILMPDVCDKSDISQGWIAQAMEGNKVANGCWQYADNNTVKIYLDIGGGIYLDYQLYRAKFKPVY